MKIVSGLGSIDDYVRLVRAGADEFFCGYVPFEWVNTYGILSPLNRREVLYYNVQIGSKSDLIILRRMVDTYQVPVKITFNSLYYMPEQYPIVSQLITECMEIGFDTFVIADVALIIYLRDHDIRCKIHLSGETAEVNHLMMEQMNALHMKRFIFHRKNTIEDMQNCICKNVDENVEYEAFILNEMCHFTGAFCNSLHCDELPHICKVPYEMARVSVKSKKFQEVNEGFLLEREEIRNGEDSEAEMDEQQSYITGSTGCGLCALMRLQQAGITHLKLVGRGNYIDYMEKDIRQLKQALMILEHCTQETEFIQRIQTELFVSGCAKQCYYKL